MLLHHCFFYFISEASYTHTQLNSILWSEVHRAAVISKVVLSPSQTGWGLNECLIGRKVFFLGGGYKESLEMGLT